MTQDEIGAELAERARDAEERYTRRLLGLPQPEEIIPGRIITYEGRIYLLEASVLRLGKVEQ